MEKGKSAGNSLNTFREMLSVGRNWGLKLYG
jgi:hypothetical protein